LWGDASLARKIHRRDAESAETEQRSSSISRQTFFLSPRRHERLLQVLGCLLVRVENIFSLQYRLILDLSVSPLAEGVQRLARMENRQRNEICVRTRPALYQLKSLQRTLVVGSVRKSYPPIVVDKVCRGIGYGSLFQKVSKYLSPFFDATDLIEHRRSLR